MSLHQHELLQQETCCSHGPLTTCPCNEMKTLDGLLGAAWHLPDECWTAGREARIIINQPDRRRGQKLEWQRWFHLLINLNFRQNVFILQALAGTGVQKVRHHNESITLFQSSTASQQNRPTSGSTLHWAWGSESQTVGCWWCLPSDRLWVAATYLFREVSEDVNIFNPDRKKEKQEPITWGDQKKWLKAFPTRKVKDLHTPRGAWEFCRDQSVSHFSYFHIVKCPMPFPKGRTVVEDPTAGEETLVTGTEMI